ncbi:MAG: hypothetical protein SFV32_02095 [Opitutaceae bacterium]|nr:hypothetical protein [Opitutaceae bacterium]
MTGFGKSYSADTGDGWEKLGWVENRASTAFAALPSAGQVPNLPHPMQFSRSSLRRQLTRPWIATLFAGLSLHALTPAEWAELQHKAEAGDVTAMHHLGLRHAAPKEAGADWVEAYVWLSLAEERGAADKALPQLKSQMTPDQLERAERRLTELRQKLGSPVTASSPAPTNTPVSATPSEEKKLSDELADAWKEADRLKEDVKEREIKVRDLTRQLEAAQLAWAEEKKDFLAKLAAGTDQVKTLQDKVQQLVQVNQQLSTSQAETRMKIAELNSQLRERQATGRDTESARTQLQKDLEARSAEVVALKTQLEKVAAEAVEARKARAESDQGIADTGARISKLTTDLSAKETELTEAKTTLEAARARVASLEGELASAQGRIGLVETELSGLKEKSVTAETELQQLRTQANATGAASGESKAQLEQLAQELEKARTALEEQRKAAEKERGRAEAMGIEIENARGRIDSLTRELNEERGKVEGSTALAEQVAVEKSRNEKAAQELQAAQAHIEKSTQELSLTRSRVAELEQQLAAKPAAPALSEEESKQREETAKQLASLEKVLSETRQANDRLNVALIDANARASTGDTVMIEVKQLRAQLEDAQRLREEAAKAAAVEQLRLAVESDRLRLQLAQRGSAEAALARLRKDLQEARFALSLAQAAEQDHRAHLEKLQARTRR